MTHRPILPALLAFAGGILAGHSFSCSAFQNPFPVLIFLGFAILCLLGSVFLLPASLRVYPLLILFFAVGFLLDFQEHRATKLPWLAEQGKEVLVEGTVSEPMKITDGFSRILLRVDAVTADRERIMSSGRILVSVYSHSRFFSPGEKILFRTRLRPFRNFENPGRYDYELAMMVKGFISTASVADGREIVPMGKGSLGMVEDGLEALRSPLRKFFRERLAPWPSALFRALILGETQDVDSELRDLFSTTGLAHVLAVSGLNVGLIAWAAYLCIKGFLSLFYGLALNRDIRKIAAVLTCIPVVGYALLAGFEVSVQRAMIMGLAYLVSIVLDRENEVWSTFSLAALTVLAIDPHAIFSVSFQLSFGGVMGLLVVLPEIQRITARIGSTVAAGRLPGYLIGLVVTTVSATLFLLPVLVFYFKRISVATVPANLMVLPFIGFWIMPLGMLAAIVLPFSDFLAGLFLQLGSWGIDLILMIMQFWAGVSWAEVWMVTPNILEMGLLYGILTCILLLKKGRSVRIALAVLLVILSGDALYWIRETRFNPCLKVTYLDVGAGNAALIQFPGRERMLIDGGGSARADFDIGRMVVAPCLLALKIRKVDYIVLSHPEADHMNGLHFIASHFEPKELWYGGDNVDSEPFSRLMDIVESRGIARRLPSDLKTPMEIGGVRMELLHPERDAADENSSRGLKLNDRSMVLKLTHGRNAFLFPGDLQKEGEQRLVSRKGRALESDVLLVPHHGSRESSSPEFLESVNPRLCVISARGGIPMRFPHPDVLGRLEARGCGILRTDRSGAIRISSRGEGLEISTYKGDWNDANHR